jgi:hypothetical protein
VARITLKAGSGDSRGTEKPAADGIRVEAPSE